jgi:hypothetical protein
MGGNAGSGYLEGQLQRGGTPRTGVEDRMKSDFNTVVHSVNNVTHRVSRGKIGATWRRNWA